MRRGGLVVSGLQFHPLSLQPGPALSYWGFVGRTLEQLAKARAVSAEERAAMAAFLQRLELKAIYEIPPAMLAEKLLQTPDPQKLKLQNLHEHQLKEEEGFDLRQHLERVKARDPVKESQQLYFLRLSVGATDNNVETGPSPARTKAPFFFLIVSENDLLAQIAMEEEVLSERLEKVMQKLQNSKLSLSEQSSKLTTGGDLELVRIRADDIRRNVLDSASVTREVHMDYTRILRELQVNRIGRGKIEDVRDRIVLPLEEIVNPNYGDFAATEEAAQKLYQDLDDDVAAKRPPRSDVHLQNVEQTRLQLDKLMGRLNDVLIAMGEGIVEARIIESVVFIERNQRDLAREFRRFFEMEQQRLLLELTQPESKK
jgi:hypothetical protein